MMQLNKPDFPFVAVRGQEAFKKALVLVAIDPTLGGVLVSGPRGAAKSTLARGLAAILPESEGRVPPFVTLPLGATEEMLLGSLNLQKVMDDQSVEFHPGILAKAHGGVLYMDEVNLLPDNLVDQLLDVSASGVNHVERDGISHRHAAEFILLGTMNPDEGQLRPQLEDRFGLSVHLDNQYSLDERIDIVEQREAYDTDPDSFCAGYQAEQARLRDVIASARKSLSGIQISNDNRRDIAQQCIDAGVDGLRADIVWNRAAVAHAAWQKRMEVTPSDIEAVRELVLAHRQKDSDKQPPSQSPSNRRPPESENSSEQPAENSSSGDWGAMQPQMQAADGIRHLDLSDGAPPVSSKPKSHEAVSGTLRGMGAKGRGGLAANAKKISWPATIAQNQGQLPFETLIKKPIRQSAQTLHIILLDTSASTLGKSLLAKAKGVALGLLEQAYLARQRMRILAFGNDDVVEVLAECRAPKTYEAAINRIEAGGGTPLRKALISTQDYLRKIQQRWPERRLRTYLITDGRTNQSLTDIHLPGEVWLLDTEESSVKRGRGPEIAKMLGASYLAV